MGVGKLPIDKSLTQKVKTKEFICIHTYSDGNVELDTKEGTYWTTVNKLLKLLPETVTWKKRTVRKHLEF